MRFTTVTARNSRDEHHLLHALGEARAQVKTQKGETISAEKISENRRAACGAYGKKTPKRFRLILRSQQRWCVSRAIWTKKPRTRFALKLNGLELAEGTKRYYPLGNFASRLLGSVSADNTGRAGIELEYDQYLAGVSGRWKKNTDLLGNELVEGAEEYHEAQDGYNVVLSLDEAIQYYVEKALEKGMEKTKAKRIMCLVMNPKTGEILASHDAGL